MAKPGAILAGAFLLSCTASWWSNDVAGAIAWNSFGVVAAMVMVVGALQRERNRAGWLLIATGLGAWVAGDITWEVLAWNDELPDLSLVDVWYHLGYLGFFAGLVVLMLSVARTASREALIDAAILGAGFVLVVWVTLVEPASEPGSFAYQVVTVGYPTWAAALLAAVAWMRFHPQRTELDGGVDLLSAAIVLLAILEPLSAWYYFEEPDIDLESLLDRMFQVAFFVMALAVFRRDERFHRRAPHRMHPLRIVMLGAALAVGPLLLVAADRSQAVVALGSMAISLLVLGRFVLLSRERERSQEALAHLASHDSLTGLANRSLLMESLDVAMLRSARRRDRAVGLCFVDVDRFKEVNDSRGHQAGDALLVEVSERLRRSVRPGDIAARFGGDEFVILCPQVAGVADVVTVAQRLRTRLAEPIEIGGEMMAVTLSVGVAVSAPGETRTDELLGHADQALYDAKRTGRNGIAVYDPTSTGGPAASADAEVTTG